MRFLLLMGLMGMALWIVGCASVAERGEADRIAEAQRQAEIRIRTYSADDEGLRANSHLISGGRDAILVDAQLTTAHARKVVELIRGAKKELKQVFITHAHADHFLGLEEILKAYPRAQVWAAPSVASEIRRTGERQLQFWKDKLPGGVAGAVVFPKPLTAGFLDLEGQRLDVLELERATESPAAAALILRSKKTLFAGDLLISDTHPWLADAEPSGWMDSLDELADAGPFDTVFIGHGAPVGMPGHAAKPADAFAATRNYLEAFVGASLPPATPEEIISRMKAFYPRFYGEAVLGLGIKNRRSPH